MFGSQMMVAPVLHKGQSEINVYLPEGIWYDFWNDQQHTGDNWVTLASTLETIPVFVKEGSFLPMVKPVNTTDDYSSKELTVRYYPAKVGDSSFYNLFEDDGKTFGTIERGEFELLRFSGIETDTGTMSIKMIRDGWDYDGMPRNRQIKLELVRHSAERKYSISINGGKIKKKKKKDSSGYYFNENNRLVIEFKWDGKLTQIDIEK
jgi:oligosaccharide 4-alpha-D-glucosyltransferase